MPLTITQLSHILRRRQRTRYAAEYDELVWFVTAAETKEVILNKKQYEKTTNIYLRAVTYNNSLLF